MQITKFVDAILAGQEYKFGELWRRKQSVGVLIPILHPDSAPRDYVLVEEVRDKIVAKDSGSINGVHVTNNSGKTVFIRSGNMFEGLGTQSRAATEGIILEPEPVPVTIPVKCVYASKGIVSTALFNVSAYSTPSSVEKHLLRKDQGAVWSAVTSYSSAHTRRGVRARSWSQMNTEHSTMQEDVGLAEEMPPGGDNLVGTVTSSKDLKAEMDAIIREIPAFENQCGLVILDMNGVVGVEIFDSPKSWEAVSKAVITKYGEVFSEKPKTPLKLDVDKESAVDLAKDFLKKIKGASFAQANKNTWVSKNPLGEYTELNGKVIHLIAFNEEDRGTHQNLPLGFRSTISPHVRTARTAEANPDFGLGLAMSSIPESYTAPESTALQSTYRKNKYKFRPRKKILTSGWDPKLLNALSHFADKELQGDKSSAVRTLAQNGLKSRGYYRNGDDTDLSAR